MPGLKRPTRNPYYSLKVADVGITVGAESTNAINVALQLKDHKYADLAVRGRVRAYLSGDANGDSVLQHYEMPEAMAIGTDGLLLPGGVPPTGLVAKGTLAIHSTPEQFKTTATAIYRVNGAQYTKSAATGLTFTAAHVVTANKYGVVLVQVNAAGTVSTKVPGATQAYNTAALALAALPAPDANNVPLGYIAIANNAGDWTANTDDLTNGSDVTTATFVDAAENGYLSPAFDLVSEADGDIDITFTETRGRTFYLACQLPDGSLKVSGAITFAP